MSVLLLNASYEPLRVISWQRAICLQLSERADLVESLANRTLHSSGGAEFPFPAVVRLRDMVFVPYRRGAAPVTRRALASRDGGMCQKVGCEKRGSTMDHLLPRSRGGEHSWHNVVLMCADHNNSKGDRTIDELGWSLKVAPRVPRYQNVHIDITHVQPEWRQWLARVGDISELAAH